MRGKGDRWGGLGRGRKKLLGPDLVLPSPPKSPIAQTISILRLTRDTVAVLHGGKGILPDASSLVAVCPPPMLAAPMRKISGVRGQSPCHHTRRRSRPSVGIFNGRFCLR
jgi:hypothetical protein